MSGLTVFFRRYLSDDAVVPSHPNTGEVILNESNRTTDSSTNAAVLLQQQQLQHPSSNRLDTDDDDDQELLYYQSISTRRTSQDERTSLRTEPVTSTNMTNSSKNSNAVSYKEWREQQTLSIQEYIAQRLFDSTSPNNANAANPSTNDANDNIDGAHSTSTTNNKQAQEEPEDDDDDAVIESQSQHPLESQAFASPPPEHEMKATPREPTFTNTSTGLVPNAYTDTYYMATNIQELDLYVHAFNASTVLPITKVWSKRTTLERRRVRHRTSKKSTISLPSWSYQYDGPLAVLYNRVVCMELFQFKGNSDKAQPHSDSNLHSLGQILDHGSTSTTTPVVTAAANMTQHNVPLPPKQFGPNMKIFWYNEYADLFQTIIADSYQSLQSTHRLTTTTAKKDTLFPTVELYLSLQNVPAKCIFPYYDEGHSSNSTFRRENTDDDGDHGFTTRPDWYDEYHTVPYCICIGGDSAMIVRATAPNNSNDNARATGEESQDSSCTIDPTTTTMKSTTTNTATCPIAFDSEDQPNTDPIQIKCYMIHYCGWNDNNDDTNGCNHNANDNTYRTLPNKIVEHTISTTTKKFQMEVYHNPTDVVQIRSIWEEIQLQRPHLLLTKDSNNRQASQMYNFGNIGNSAFCRHNTNTTTDHEDHPLVENENELRRLSTPGRRMSLSELTSPGERLKRRRLNNIATDDIQYQLVCFIEICLFAG